MWDEYKIINEEMLFMTPFGECMRDEEEIGKYGQVVKVMTKQRPWRQIFGQSTAATETKDARDDEAM